MVGFIDLLIAIPILIIIGIKNRNLNFEDIFHNIYVQILSYSLLAGTIILLIKTCTRLLE